jgi:hypothetical protein
MRRTGRREGKRENKIEGAGEKKKKVEEERGGCSQNACTSKDCGSCTFRRVEVESNSSWMILGG